MVAYSFKARFAEPILAGTKRQTIRAPRKRHAHPGEELQLYTGMRTKQCKLIRRAQCTHVVPIDIDLAAGVVTIPTQVYDSKEALDIFARADGFADWADMCAFWRKEHPGLDLFDGVLIRWAV